MKVRPLQMFLWLLVGASAITVVATPVAGNLWSVLTGRGYFIPQESSVFTFNVLVENAGSGEWWLLAEDRRHFYAIREKEPGYLVFPKNAIKDCPRFSMNDAATWCSQFTSRMTRSAAPLPNLAVQPTLASYTRSVG